MSTGRTSGTISRIGGTDGATPTATARVYPLDWLRVLALLGVFVYHTMRPFDTNDWHVKNDQQSEIITIVLSSMIWGLVLFFLLAGAGSALALRWRTTGQHLRERLLRLGVPLVVGYLLLSPVQAFIQETHFGRYHGSFLASIPTFFRTQWAQLRDGPDLPLVVPWAGHLWFLVFLLWFSLLGLPLLTLLRRPSGRRLTGWLGRHAQSPGAVLWWAVPLALLNAAVGGPGTVEHGWGEFVLYFGPFLAGALLLADRRLLDAVRRDLRPALTLAIITTLAIGVTLATGFAQRWFEVPYSWQGTAAYLLVSVWIWAAMMTALSAGLRFAAFRKPLPRLAGATAMPFFLIHQPVILAVAFFVVRWNSGIAVKLPAVLTISLAITVPLAIGLARIPYLSTLLGVKHRPAQIISHRRAAPTE
jgi:peptidoglycan/LPS O-acetylase OafA/YrhL